MYKYDFETKTKVKYQIYNLIFIKFIINLIEYFQDFNVFHSLTNINKKL